ncbi:MAG: hypothetical protein LBM93_03430 [Oscillospiraceae bacterium]|jgi:hypothetical protein|nr:hypothetical protein [Oscillospiraceae bacterium]
MFNTTIDNNKELIVPLKGIFAAEDNALSKKRKELAERLKTGQAVSVTPSGTLVKPNSPESEQLGGKTLNIPEGILAYGYYWYEKDPELFESEKKAMRDSFPNFKLDKLEDGRLCWEGELTPCGEEDIHWHILAVYDNNHPSNSTYGGSVKIYSLSPDLDELQAQVGGRGLPHILRDESGHLYMCTARKEDVDAGNVVTSASSSLRWAIKWTFAVTCWLNGDVGDEIYDHTF